MCKLNPRPINLNDHVYFEITKEGLALFDNDPKELVDFIKYHVHTHEVSGKQVNMVKMQLWEFIERFGSQIHLWSRPIAGSNNLYIESDQNKLSGVLHDESLDHPLKIGNQIWSPKNLSVDDGGDGIYHNEYNGEVMYSYKAAIRIVNQLPGWHLPSMNEWKELITYCGGDTLAGDKLKSDVGWNGNANGTNDVGFSVKPHGTVLDGKTTDVGSNGFFWTATENNGLYSEAIVFNTSPVVYERTYDKTQCLSIRLLRNNISQNNPNKKEE